MALLFESRSIILDTAQNILPVIGFIAILKTWHLSKDTRMTSFLILRQMANEKSITQEKICAVYLGNIFIICYYSPRMAVMCSGVGLPSGLDSVYNNKRLLLPQLDTANKLMQAHLLCSHYLDQGDVTLCNRYKHCLFLVNNQCL